MANKEKDVLKGTSSPKDHTKGVRKGDKANLLTNLELPMDYHGSDDLFTPQPDAAHEKDYDD